MILAQVYKEVGGLFTVKLPDNTKLDVKARGIIKLDDEIFVGDIVEIEKLSGEYIIKNVQRRKNQLIRPYVTNVDLALIVVAPVPKPDFYVVDKQIISLMHKNIPVCILVNKSDMKQAKKLLKNIHEQYGHVVDIIELSSVSKTNIDKLIELIDGKLTVLSGQSAVGKSSLINAIMEREILGVGDVSKKSQRGKNTTRTIEIVDLDDHGTRIIDTCGFSSFDLRDVDENALREFYIDFNESAKACRYRDCLHLDELECGVKKAIEEHKINLDRYERYKKLYQEIKLKNAI